MTDGSEAIMQKLYNCFILLKYSKPVKKTFVFSVLGWIALYLCDRDDTMNDYFLIFFLTRVV